MKMLHSVFPLIFTFLFSACSGSGEVGKVKNPRDVASSITDVSANKYIEVIAGGKGLKSLSVDSLYSVDFSGTPFVNIPLAGAVFDANNRIRPGKAPNVSAYRAITMMNTSDAAMENLYSQVNQPEIINHDVTLDILRIRYTDQFIYQVDVPDLGYVAEARVSAVGVMDPDSNTMIYTDSPILKGYDQPVKTLKLSNIRYEDLNSLPNFMLKERSIVQSGSHANVYWFSDNYLSTDYYTVVNTGGNEFAEINGSKRFKFVARQMSASSEKMHPLFFNGSAGAMVEIK